MVGLSRHETSLLLALLLGLGACGSDAKERSMGRATGGQGGASGAATGEAAGRATNAGGTTSNGGHAGAGPGTGGTNARAGSPPTGGSSNEGTAGRTSGVGGTTGSGGVTGSGGTGGASAGAGGEAGAEAGNGGADAGGDGGDAGTSGNPSPNPSCATLPPVCGPDGTSDCCASQRIPGGSFQLDNGVGSSVVASVSDFRLDKYEISVGRFRRFVAAYPGNRPTQGSGKNPNDASDTGWDETWNAVEYLPGDQAALAAAVQCSSTYQTWTGTDDGLPMNCITWYEAFAFCIWDGGRLPTDVEWNYAAAGGSEQRYYPWSNPPKTTTIDTTYAVYDFNAQAGPTRVGSRSPRGDGRWGQSDLAGNLWEWARDGSADHTFSYANPCDDCTAASGGAYRAARGGGFLDAATVITTFFGPASTAPLTRYTNYGARCARSAD
jgi:formylglycine-generating enzyme required for sulfatase activity